MNLNFINYTNLSLDTHKLLLKIRNDINVRKNMKNDSLIVLENHLSWVKALDKDNTKKYFAIFSNNELLGGINITDIDYSNKTASWGLFTKSNTNPMIPSIATYLLIEKIFHTLNIRILNLEVNKRNINAHKFDKNFGFIDVGEYNDEKNTYYLMQMKDTDWENNKYKPLLKVVKNKIDNSHITFKD